MDPLVAMPPGMKNQGRPNLPVQTESPRLLHAIFRRRLIHCGPMARIGLSSVTICTVAIIEAQVLKVMS